MIDSFILSYFLLLKLHFVAFALCVTNDLDIQKCLNKRVLRKTSTDQLVGINHRKREILFSVKHKL